MKRPSFQFYPADWRNNAKLRRCSEAARGAWMDVLCLMHDSDEYGVLRWPLSDIARATGLPIKLLKELADREVLKGSDKGCDAFYHIPIHARKEGTPVLLIDKTDQPCWYSSRFLVDEWRRKVKGANTRFGSDEDSPNTPPEVEPDNAPSHGKVKGKVKENDSPDHEPSARQGDGSTSSSTSSIKTHEETHTVEDCNVPERTPIGIVCAAIKAEFDLQNKAIMDMSQSNPTLIALVNAGASEAEFSDAAKKAASSGKGFGYVLGIVKRQREEAAKLVLHKGALPDVTQKPQSIHDKRSATAKAMFGDITNANNQPRIIDVSDYTAEPDRPLISSHG